MGLLSKLSIGEIDLPVGPQADARELEYICCLLQTALPDLRQDATISATDIRLYLRSRYGLSITNEVAIDIVNGLGGGDDARRMRRLRNQHRQHESEKGDLDGGYGGDPNNSDASATSEAVGADEEMGLFASATASGVVDSNVVGDDGEEKEMTASASTANGSRQSSLFFDAMQSANNIGDVVDDNDGADGGDQGAVVETAVKTSGESAALHVNTDLEVPRATGELKRSVQWSKKFSASTKAPPISPKSTSNSEVYLDPIQVLGALLIPTLIKAKREADIANGIIEDDAPIPDNPEISFHQLLHQPRQFFANHRESMRLERRRKERDELDSLRPTPRRLIRDVLVMMIHHLDESNPNPMLRRAQESKDVRNKSPASATPRLRRLVINEDVVRDLLLSFGEFEAADDDELIREMVIVAGGDGATFDELAFSRALTSDILAWTCGMEDGVNETFADVFGFDPVAKNEYDLARSLLEAGADVVADAADLAVATGMTAANVAIEAVDAIKPAVETQTHCDSPAATLDEAATPAVAGDKKKEGQSQEDPIKFVHTAHYIDYVCDSFQSLLFQMALYGE